MECTDRPGIIQVYVAGDRIEISVLPAEMEVRVYPRGLTTDIAEKLRPHENPAVEKSMSGRLFLKNASVLVSPILGVTIVLDVVCVAVDVTTRLTFDEFAVDTPDHLRTLIHRDEIVFRRRVRARVPHRKYETKRPRAEQPREIGILVHTLRQIFVENYRELRRRSLSSRISLS